MSIGSIVRATIADFGKMLRVPAGDAEDALHSERAAHAVLTRRNLFAAAGAMAAGTLVSVPVASVECPAWVHLSAYGWDLSQAVFDIMKMKQAVWTMVREGNP